MKKLISKLTVAFLCFFFQNLSSTEFIGDFKQGSFIIGKTSPNSKVVIDKKKIRITKDGVFVFGLGRDRKNNVIIKISNKGNEEIIEKKSLKRSMKFKKLTDCLKSK